MEMGGLDGGKKLNSDQGNGSCPGAPEGTQLPDFRPVCLGLDI